MSKKNGNKSSKKQQNNGTFSPVPQNVALGLVKRRFPELFSNVLTDGILTQMASEERAKWKEEHINEIKHSSDFWKL